MLREARHKKGLSLRQLGREIGVSHVFIGEVERGKRKLPVDRAEAWADALDLDADRLRAMYGPVPQDIREALRDPAFVRMVRAMMGAR